MQRHMPMGYKISDGKITVDKEKAEIIKTIFESFISGKSMIKISQELTESRVPNANGKPSWNHCSVGNILKNIKYIGDEYHPAIITEEDYRTAERLRTERAKQLNHSNNYLANSKTAYPFSGKLICGECGAIFKRYTEHHNANKKCNWKCKRYIVNNRVCCRSAVIDDVQLEQAFIDVVKMVLKGPELIDMRSRNRELTAKSIDTPEQEAAQTIVKYLDTEGKVRLLFSKAAEEYINCSVNVDDFKYQTNKLKKMFSKLTSVRVFDRGLFLESVRHITIHASGVLWFEFINGAVVETTYESRRRTNSIKK